MTEKAFFPYRENPYNPRGLAALRLALWSIVSNWPWSIDGWSAGWVFDLICFFSALANLSKSLSFFSIAVNMKEKQELKKVKLLKIKLTKYAKRRNFKKTLTGSCTYRTVPRILIWLSSIWRWRVHLAVLLAGIGKQIDIGWRNAIGMCWPCLHQILASTSLVWWQVASENRLQIYCAMLEID